MTRSVKNRTAAAGPTAGVACENEDLSMENAGTVEIRIARDAQAFVRENRGQTTVWLDSAPLGAG